MHQHSLPLTRPLVFLDVEATGANATVDRICELSLVKYHPGGLITSWTRYVNPQKPVEPQAVLIHGLTDEFLAQQPTLGQLLPEILLFLHGCDIGGFNVLRFDITILMEDFGREGYEGWPAEDVKIVDAFIVFSKMNPRTLGAAVKTYLGHELEGAHGAEADTRATGRVFEAQLRAHQADIGATVEEWHRHCTNDALVDFAAKLARNPETGEVLYNFGQHKGRPVLSEPSYARWMLTKDFPTDTKRKLRALLNPSTPL